MVCKPREDASSSGKGRLDRAVQATAAADYMGSRGRIRGIQDSNEGGVTGRTAYAERRVKQRCESA